MYSKFSIVVLESSRSSSPLYLSFSFSMLTFHQAVCIALGFFVLRGHQGAPPSLWDATPQHCDFPRCHRAIRLADPLDEWARLKSSSVSVTALLVSFGGKLTVVDDRKKKRWNRFSDLSICFIFSIAFQNLFSSVSSFFQNFPSFIFHQSRFQRTLRFSIQPSTSATPRRFTFFPSAYCTFNPFEGHSAPIRHRPQTIKLKILGLILKPHQPPPHTPPKTKGFLQSPTI